MRKVLAAAITSIALLAGCSSSSDSGQAVQIEGALMEQGLAAYKAGDYAGAERAWSQILQTDPGDPAANLNLGVVKALTDRKQEALAHYQLAIQNGTQTPLVQTIDSDGTVTEVTTTVEKVARDNVSQLKM